MEVALVAGHTWDVDIDTRCHACAALATVKRDVHEKHKDDKTFTGRQLWEDGRIHTVSLLRARAEH